MKKMMLSVVAVLAIPLLLGCGDKGFGGFGSGEWAETPTSSVTTLSPKILIGKTTTLSNTSIRALLNLAGSQVSLVLGDYGHTVVPFGTVEEGDKNLSYAPAAGIKVTDLAKNSAGDKYVLDVRVLVNGVTFKIKLEVPVLIGGTTADSTKSDLVATLNFAADAFGSVTYTYTLGYIAYGSTSPGAPVSGTVPSGTKNSLPTLYVEKVVWGSTVLGAYRVSNIQFDVPVFKVYFNQALAGLPATYSLKVTAGNADLSFDSSTNGLITMELDSTKKIVTVTVKGQGGDSQLKPGTDYDVIFKSSTIVNVDKSANASIAAGTTYKITTKKAVLSSWEAKDVSNTAIGSSKDGKATTAARNLVLTFDYAVTKPADYSGATYSQKTPAGDKSEALPDGFDSASVVATS